MNKLAVKLNQPVAPVKAEDVVTILPRTTFKSASDAIQQINDQVEAHHAHMTLVRNYIPQSIGALKSEIKDVKSNQLRIISMLEDISARLATVESAE